MRRHSSQARFPAGALVRFLSSAAVTAVLAAGLGGCQTMSDVTGALTSSKAQAAPDDPRRAVEVYGERHRANPKDAEAALAYGQALRASGQRAQAAAVLEQATIAHPGNKTMLAADFFAHTSSNGESFEQRVEQFFPSKRIGETLAYISGKSPGGKSCLARLSTHGTSTHGYLANGAERAINRPLTLTAG